MLDMAIFSQRKLMETRAKYVGAPVHEGEELDHWQEVYRDDIVRNNARIYPQMEKGRDVFEYRLPLSVWFLHAQHTRALRSQDPVGCTLLLCQTFSHVRFEISVVVKVGFSDNFATIWRGLY